MHEKSLMDDLMKKIVSLAEKERASKVTKVRVQLGALSHMSKEHFQEHFEIASQGTIAQGAEIEAEELHDLHDPKAASVILKNIDVQ